MSTSKHLSKLTKILDEVINLMDFLQVEYYNYENDLAYNLDLHNHISNLQVKKYGTKSLSLNNSHFTGNSR